jgi:hypothetical protein
MRRSTLELICLCIILGCSGLAGATNYYVAPAASGGSDSNPGTIGSPWATPLKAWTMANAGDTVYFRAGSYAINTQINTRFIGYNGTADNPIVFQNYPSEAVTFTSTLTGVVYYIEKSYNYVQGINFVGAATWFRVADQTNATYFKASNCTATMSYGADNCGFVDLSCRAIGSIVENCRIIGPGRGSDIHHNTGGIMLATNGVKLLHNEISNMPVGIYFKWPNDVSSSTTTGIEIAYNYIHDTGRNAMAFNCNYAYIHDNVIGPNNESVEVNAYFGETSGDFNIFEHNTFYDTQANLNLTGSTAAGDPYPGAIGNTVKNSLFCTYILEHWYYSVPSQTVSDWNLYRTGNAVGENLIYYTLSAWKVHYPGTDAHSIAGAPIFVGGATPTTLAGFALAANSPGKNAASDGKDMGADISMVGLQMAATAVNDSYSVNANQTLTVPSASGLLLNDTGSTPMTAIKVTDPSHGSLSLSSDGGFVYTPTTGYSGSDSFTYKAHNPRGDSNTATVTITISSASPPTAPSNLSGTVPSSSQINLTWADNSGDETGFKIERHFGYDNPYTQIALAAANAVSYSDTNLWYGTQYTYRVRATNSAGDSAYSNEFTIMTRSVADDDSYSVYTNRTLTVAVPGVLSNDVGNSPWTAVKVTEPSHGIVTLNTNGGFVYTPTTGYSGSDSFTYKVNNTGGDSNTATVNIAVNQPTRILIDVGSDLLSSTTSPNSDGRYWNNFTAASGSPSFITSCTTATGSLSGIRLTRTANFFYHGSNASITTAINGWPLNAAKDYFSVSSTTVPSAMEFSLLDTSGSKTYDLTVFGSMGSSGTTQYTVLASSTTSRQLNCGGTPVWATFSNLTPDANGKITLQVLLLTNGQRAPLNVMDLAIYNTSGVGGADMLLAGDITGNGYVDGGDLNILLSNWNATNATRAMGDLTGDGYVDGGDLNVLLSNWNAGTALAGNAVAGATSSANTTNANTTVTQTTVDALVSSSGTDTVGSVVAQANTFTAHINYQPASIVAPQGCLVDSGMPFGKQTNGYTYGWTTDLSSFAVQRNNASSPDIRYDTAVMLVSGGTWEMSVPNGMYDVKIVTGDNAGIASASDNGSLVAQKFTVEGVPAAQTQAQSQTQANATATAGWSEETVTVVVTDGKLTIVGQPGSSLCFVQITGR